MKNLLLAFLLLIVSPILAHAEGKFVVNGTNNGQFTDLAVTGANTSTTKRSGVKATIDLSSIAQTSTSATTTPVLALSQSATTAPIFGVTCTSGALNSCPSYTTTNSAKAGSIAILVNGSTRYLNFYNSQN